MKKINLPDALFFISDGSILYKRFGNDGLFRHRMNLVSIMKTEGEEKTLSNVTAAVLNQGPKI